MPKSIPPNRFLARGESWPEGEFVSGPADQGAVEAARMVATVARAIAYKRNFRGWSQTGLAAQAGVSRYTVSRIEAGSAWPDLQVLLRICVALDLTLEVSPSPGSEQRV